MIITERPPGVAVAEVKDGPAWANERKSVVVIVATATLRRSVSRTLARVPFDVHEAVSADRGLALAAAQQAALVVVECEVAASTPNYLRDLWEASATPIMLIGPDPDQGWDGLESTGVVDYVRSPVWHRELRARAVRHAGAGTGPAGRGFGNLSIDWRTRSVSVAGRHIALTPREFDLIEFLATHPGTVFTRSQLLERVWGSSPRWQRIDTVTEHIYRLRRKLEIDPASPEFIITVPKAGYCFGAGAQATRRAS